MVIEYVVTTSVCFVAKLVDMEIVHDGDYKLLLW